MALVLRDRTRCSICGDVLGKDDKIVGLLHCLPVGHPLWRFSDSVVHQNCFEGWSHRSFFEAIHDKWRQIVKARPALSFQVGRVEVAN